MLFITFTSPVGPETVQLDLRDSIPYLHLGLSTRCPQAAPAVPTCAATRICFHHQFMTQCPSQLALRGAFGTLLSQPPQIVNRIVFSTFHDLCYSLNDFGSHMDIIMQDAMHIWIWSSE